MMFNSMDILRYRMFWKGAVTWREKRELKYLKPGMEAQRQVVMKALGQTHDLTRRMDDCGSKDVACPLKSGPP